MSLRLALLRVVGAIQLVAGCHCLALAEEPALPRESQDSPRALTEYRSQTLHVWTDLKQDDARHLFTRLEKTLKFASRYWGQKPRGQIECYVVDDLNNWADDKLPHRLARIIISGVGGATFSKVAEAGSRSRYEPMVFASSHPGVAEHEIIHAYCLGTFGAAGPEWYKEGMAEMMVRGCTRETGVLCSPEQITSLRTHGPAALDRILHHSSTGEEILSILRNKMDDPAHRDGHVPLEAWTAEDSDKVRQAREEYLKSWLLCYMLLHNPNYSQRFRSLGNVFVTSRNPTLDDFFGSVRDQMTFEFDFLLARLEAGYRVDLCHWDWRSRFRCLEAGCSQTTVVQAARGYQASGLAVSVGQRYYYEADGLWTTGAKRAPFDADGHLQRGRLLAVIMTDLTLGEPFWLGTRGNFVSPAKGDLYLRCEDDWHSLSDNTGQVRVRLRVP